MPNPPCPQCGDSSTTKSGHTKAGTQRFKCNACKKTWTDKSAKRPAKSKAQLQREYYRRNKEKLLEAQRQRRKRKKENA